MASILTNYGEEWYHVTDISGLASVDYGLYNDSTDTISDTDDLAAITEPGGAAYARQSEAITVSDISGDIGFDNDNTITFDTSDSTLSVDSYFIVGNFQSTVVGADGSAVDHLVITGALSQTYDLSNVDTLEINAGTAGNSLN